MTVSYNQDVSPTSMSSFLKLQMRWKGSIWKAVFKELLLFSTVFLIITFICRSNYFLSEKQRAFCSDFAALFDQKLDFIPLAIMLGFFVTILIKRWNDIFLNLAWVDNAALALATYVRGTDENTRILRRNVVRYMVLAQVLVLRDLSAQVRRRFPTLDTVVAAGFMMEPERAIYEANTQSIGKCFLPIQWCFSLLFKARQSGIITGDVMLNEIIKHITEFRNSLGQLSKFDTVPIPLIYPQVVFLTVRSYFFICLFARQSVVISGETTKDDNTFTSGTSHRSTTIHSPCFQAHIFMFPAFFFVPFFMTLLQYIFYVGWMKVAESLMNPLGEDDDAFECNRLIDRNTMVGLSIESNHNEVPIQMKDCLWVDEVCDQNYSEDVAARTINLQIGAHELLEDELVIRYVAAHGDKQNAHSLYPSL